MKRRQDEADAIRKRNDELRQKHNQFVKEAEKLAIKDERDRERERRERERERERERHRRDKEEPVERQNSASKIILFHMSLICFIFY